VIKPEDHGLLDEDANILPPPKLTVNVTAVDALQILMTKTCLDVLNNLGAAFSDAYQLKDMEGSLGQKIVPYLFKNRTGKDMAFILDSSFVPSAEHGSPDLDNVHTDEDIYMDLKATKEVAAYKSVIRSTQNQAGKTIKFQMLGEATKFDLPIQKAKKVMYSLPQYQVVATIEALIGQKVVTFTSCVMVTNHLEVPMEVLYHDTSGMVNCGVAYPDQPFPVPLAAVYCSTGEIFFQPKTEEVQYSASKECIKWKTINDSKKAKQFTCEASTEGKPSYYFNVVPLFENVQHGAKPEGKTEKAEKGDKMVNLHLHPTVILHNLLPLEITYTLENQPEESTLASSLNIPLPHAAVNMSNLQLQIAKYRGLTWTAKKIIKLDVPELSVLTFQADDSGKTVYMDLGLHSKQRDGSFDLSVYSPYWIINLSDQDLAFKEDDKEAPLIHKKQDKDIMLFFYRDKPMFGSGTKRKRDRGSGEGDEIHMGTCGCCRGPRLNRCAPLLSRRESKSSPSGKKSAEKTKEVSKKPGKVMLRVAEAEWSDKFSLDTVGSSGNVTCKVKATGGTMEVGLTITLAASGLTKVATFTPFYLLQNASTVPISVRENSETSEWIVVEASECKPFYPLMSGKEMKIVAKVEDDTNETVPFFLNKAHTTLLKLDDKYGGLNADCRVSESQMITTFKTYKPGMATVQFVNHLQDCEVKIKQTGSTEEAFTLEPQTSQLYTWNNPTGKREVTWSCGKKEAKSALEQDQLEEFFAGNDQKAYLVSFLDGMQRVVMFTEDLALATVAQEAGELEQADQEINLKIHDMGFALINNEKMLELTYMGITSSGVIWEEKKKRLKAMKLKDMSVLEHAYQKYLMELSAGKAKSVVMLENKLEFDNQLRQAVFPTILAPIPPPKSVAADSVPKPFVEISLMTRIHEHSDLIQVKYFKVLVQEMNLQIDQGILNELLGLFASDASTQREQEVVAFKADVEATKRDLKEQAGVSMKAKSVTFYDYFHVSPIKIHLSFSLQGMGSSDSAQSMIFGVFLQSVGVVLTDVQDVLFKLGYFERNHSFYNNPQLTSELIRHYSGQAMKQMYVLVLGLDVIGNPFGLVRGFSEGIEDLFYEPYQGAIQGPEEFAEGLALGVRSLFGHAVGGAAGAVSRITGTLGKGLAALTLDDDYQKKRREQLNKKPASAREGFARGGKGLVMGVFDGVTGIVRKPVEGAKQEGVSGFFKGMGKGLVGVVTRPTSGVVDFASSSLEGIRRITDFSEEVHRLRPPRIFKKDGIVRPYKRVEAEGYNLLYETDKGQYSVSDEYVIHINVKGDGKTVFIVTDKRLMLAKRGELFGAWDSEWVFTFQELKSVPKQIPKGIEILLKDPKKKNFFSGTVTKKEIHILDPKVASEVLAKIEAAMEGKQVEEK
ncbi:vacuolar protein sorting-associated protein 13A-like, partial [Elysia marginata]